MKFSRRKVIFLLSLFQNFTAKKKTVCCFSQWCSLA